MAEPDPMTGWLPPGGEEEPVPVLPADFDVEAEIDRQVGRPALPPERLVTPLNPTGEAPQVGMTFGQNVRGQFRTSGLTGAMSERAQIEAVRDRGEQIRRGGFSEQQFRNLPSRVQERILAENENPAVAEQKLADAEDAFFEQVAYDLSQANLSVASVAGSIVGTFGNPENFAGISGLLVRQFPALAGRPIVTSLFDNAITNVATDIAAQVARVAGGAQEEYSPLQTAIGGIIGAGFGAGMAGMAQIPSFVRNDLAARVGRDAPPAGLEPAKTSVEAPRVTETVVDTDMPAPAAPKAAGAAPEAVEAPRAPQQPAAAEAAVEPPVRQDAAPDPQEALDTVAARVRSGEANPVEAVAEVRTAVRRVKEDAASVAELPAVRERLRAIDELERQIADASGVGRAEDVTTEIRTAFGRDADRLIDDGSVVVVQSVKDLPARPDGVAHPDDVKGLFDGKTAYLVADNMAAGEARGVLLHEIGTHAGMRPMLGEELYAKVLDEVEAKVKAGEGPFADAARAVPEDTPAAHRAEEMLAYLVESAPELPLVQRVLAAVRQWAYRFLGGRFIDLTEADLREMAVAALRNWRPDAQGRPSGVLYGRGTELVRTVQDLLKGAREASSWADWYDRYQDDLNRLFGSDADLFQKMLSATSQANNVVGNVSLALKAYRQYLEGQPFEGYLPAVIGNLNRIREEEAIRGQKISQYGDATAGDADAIAVDRHIAELFYDVKSPSPAQVEAAKGVVRSIAAELGWKPRDVQAALWAYNQIRKGKEPRSYDTYLKAKADQIAELRARFGRGEEGGVPEGGPTGGGAGAAEGRAVGDAGGVQQRAASDEEAVALYSRRKKQTGDEIQAAEKAVEATGRRVVKADELDALVGSNRIPKISLRDLIGKKIFPTIADRTAAAVLYTGIDGSKIDVAIPMLGGPRFPMRESNVDAGVVWANRGDSVTSQKTAKLKEGADYMMVVLGDANMHQSNTTVSNAYFATFHAYQRDGRISPENAQKITAIVRKSSGENEAIKKALREFPGFGDDKVLDDYVHGMSFEARKRLLTVLGTKEVQALGGPNFAKILDATRDPAYAGNRWGDGVMVVRVDQDRPLVDLGTEGTTPHPDFPLGIRGEVVGVLDTPINYQALWGDYMGQQNAKLARWLAMPPDQRPGKQAPNPRRAFELSKPIVEVTEDVVRRVGDYQSRGIDSPRQARLAVDMGLDRWKTSDAPITKGGVSPQGFLDAIANSDAHATLSTFELPALKKDIKSGRMRVYQLGDDGQIFFALKKGDPGYAASPKDGGYGFTHPDIGPNEVTLTSVVNNEQGARGIGGPAVVLKAIEEGATVLDAFAVKTPRYPDGFLPHLYGEFGFEKLGEIPFDPRYYDALKLADAEAYWAKNGWVKDRDGYPPLVIMKWRGTDAQRAGITRRYARGDLEGLLSGGVPRFAQDAANDVLVDAGPAPGGAGQAASVAGGARGLEGDGNRAPLASRAQSVIRNVAGLTDEAARNLGLTPDDVKTLKAVLGDSTASVVKPDEPVTFRYSRGEKKERVGAIVAYHGSPHDFDRFDMSKIGTGEGAQAYGHGLYFAENEDIARSYRDVLAGANNRFMDSGKGGGVVIENPIGDGWRAAMYQGEPGFKNQTGLATRGLDDQFFPTFDEALAHARKQGYIKHDSPALTHWDDGYHKPIDSAGIGNLEDLTGAQIVARDPGRMYEVRINADPEHFLDWDKPLSQRLQMMAEERGINLKQAAEDLFDGQPSELTARDLYQWLSGEHEGGLGSPENVAKALREAGIPGIKYLDAGSRSAGDGSRNYVVFDDSLVEIVNKYSRGRRTADPEAIAARVEELKAQIAGLSDDVAGTTGETLFRRRGARPGQNLPPDQIQQGRPVALSGQPAPAEPVRVTRLEDLSRQLVDGFQAIGRQGGVKPGARGQFSPSSGVTRVRSIADFNTVAHEIGHDFHLAEATTDVNALIRANRAELTNLGSGDKKGDQEAFAELFRLYVTNPVNAARDYPNATLALDTLLRQRFPERHKLIEDIAKQLDAIHRAPSGEVVSADTISSTPQSFPTLRKALEKDYDPSGRTLYSAWDALYTGAIDKDHPVWKAVEGLKAVARDHGRDINVKPVDDPYILLRMASGSNGVAATQLEHGVIPASGDIPAGPSLGSAITKALGEKWDDQAFKEFGAYLTARRMVAEYARFFNGEIPNPPGKFSLADYRTAVAEFEAKYPTFAAAAQDVYTFLTNHLMRAYEKGLFSKEYVDAALSRKDYVPFVRDMADFKDAGDVSTGRPDASLRYSVMKTFRGSQRSVQNPLESIFKRVHDLEFVIARNDAVNAMARLVDEAGPGSGAIGEHVPSNRMTAQKVDVIEALRAAGKKANVDPDDLKALILQAEDLLEDSTIATLFRQEPIKENGDAIVYRWVNGERRALLLADGRFGREMYHAFTALTDVERNWFVSILQIGQMMLRTGVTRSPDFLAVNIIRDQFTAAATAGRGYIPFVNAVKGGLAVWNQTDEAKIYAGRGGMAAGAITDAMDRADFGRNVRSLEKAGVIKNIAAGDVFGAGKGFLHKTVKALEYSEASTRMGLFQSYYRQAMDIGLDAHNAALYATFKATDYIDFRKSGASMGLLRRWVPFLNAALQGTDREVRALADLPVLEAKRARGEVLTSIEVDRLKDARVAWVRVMLLGAVLGTGLAVLNADKPEYQSAPEFTRNTNFLFNVNDTWFAIPKPFGTVQTVVNAFERGAEYAIRRDPALLGSFLSAAGEAYKPPIHNPFVSLAYDLPANYDRFRERPIVPFYLQGIDPAKQYTPGTSELAKAIGDATGWSPMKVDYFIRNLGGSMATNLLRSADMAMGNDAPEKQVYDLPLVGRFVKNLERGNAAQKEFMKLVAEKAGIYEQKEGAYRNMIRSGQRTAADAYLRSLDADQRIWVTMQALGFEAKEKRLHPMQNAKDHVAIISGVIQQMNTNNLVRESDLDRTDLTRSRRDATPITMPASTRAKFIEELQSLQMAAARNAMVAVEARGTRGLQMLPLQPHLDRLKMISPEAFAEYEARKEAKKIYDPEVTFQSWQEVKARVLRDGENADLTDLVPPGADRKRKRRRKQVELIDD